MKHKNSQKRIHSPENTLFITAITKNRFPYFQEEVFCDVWIEELKLCKQMYSFDLYAFCLLHDHFHIVLRADDVSKVIGIFKRNFSLNANKILQQSSFSSQFEITSLYKESEDVIPRDDIQYQVELKNTDTSSQALSNKKLKSALYIGEKTHSRLQEKQKLQQEHFSNILLPLYKNFHHKYQNPLLHFPKFQWQQSFHDHIIRNQKDFERHIHYTIYNFAKHHLTEDWRYTSLNFPELIDIM